MMYSKINWKNLPDKTTPINADNLNHVDQGIYDISAKIGDDDLTTEEQTIIAAINEVKSTEATDKAAINADIATKYSTLNTKIDTTAATINSDIATKYSTLNTKIDTTASTLNTKIDSTSTTLDSKIDSSVSTLNSTINSNVTTLNNTISTSIATAISNTFKSTLLWSNPTPLPVDMNAQMEQCLLTLSDSMDKYDYLLIEHTKAGNNDMECKIFPVPPSTTTTTRSGVMSITETGVTDVWGDSDIPAKYVYVSERNLYREGSRIRVYESSNTYGQTTSQSPSGLVPMYVYGIERVMPQVDTIEGEVIS